MATTVRYDIFETNSSSSHSISIQDKNDIEIIDGVLNLSDLSKFTCKSNDEYGTDITICDTFNKKLVLLIALLTNYDDEDKEHNILIQLKVDNKINNVVGEFSIWDDYSLTESVLAYLHDDSKIIIHKYERY